MNIIIPVDYDFRRKIFEKLNTLFKKHIEQMEENLNNFEKGGSVYAEHVEHIKCAKNVIENGKHDLITGGGLKNGIDIEGLTVLSRDILCAIIHETIHEIDPYPCDWWYPMYFKELRYQHKFDVWTGYLDVLKHGPAY